MKLKTFQATALDALEFSNHVICISATGSGKSYIYERFSMQPNIRTLVISPLVALIHQQKNKLSQLGCKDYAVLSPESLQTVRGKRVISDLNPNFLVIDECHCLWGWGERFRPSFREIFNLFTKQNFKYSLWLTATLPKDHKLKIQQFFLDQGTPLLGEVGRFTLPESLKLTPICMRWSDRLHFLSYWFKRMKDQLGLIYVATRNQSERISRWIEAVGLRSVYYHAGISWEEKLQILQMIHEKKIDVIVATSAFGLGVHFESLTWAVLLEPPYDLLDLAQICGRVGRGNRRGEAVILWSKEDFKVETEVYRALSTDLMSTFNEYFF